MSFADMHTHSEYSHDSECKIEDMCLSQIERGAFHFAVTDHCDICYADRIDVLSPIADAFNEVRVLNEKYNGMILSGVEIGDSIWFPDTAKKAINLKDYDVIIGSVHCVKSKTTDKAYSSIDFSVFSDGEIYDYLECYFDDMSRMLSSLDFDVLAHLTCPLRYICGRYGRKIDMSRYSEKIDSILKTIISRSIALEVNTSSYYGITHEFSPDISIIKRYKDMGGKLITLASDAHLSDRASVYFEEAIEQLVDIGFADAYFYKNRKPVAYKMSASR